MSVNFCLVFVIVPIESIVCQSRRLFSPHSTVKSIFILTNIYQPKSLYTYTYIHIYIYYIYIICKAKQSPKHILLFDFIFFIWLSAFLRHSPVYLCVLINGKYFQEHGVSVIIHLSNSNDIIQKLNIRKGCVNLLKAHGFEI